MERIRAQFLEDNALVPKPPNKIKAKPRSHIIISDSDDDESDTTPFRPPQKTVPQDILKSSTNSSQLPPAPRPVKMDAPSPALPSTQPGEEAIDLAGIVADPYERTRSANDTQKALMELVQSGSGDNDEEVDMSLAVVEGFSEDFKLKAHQVRGRIWMTERETGKKSGGILGDMGLGKTAQVICRIVDHKLRDDDSKDAERKKWGRTTLVLCPPAVVPQWCKEIERIAPILRVKQHHGPKRTAEARDFRKYDVVVSSFNTLASEHGNRLSANAPTGGGDSDSDSDGSDLGKKLAARRKKKTTAKPKPTALYDLPFLRVVLDEAHTIKNKTTNAAKACFDLKSKFHWCLTGTPIQNSVDELFPLIKFLQIRPLNEWETFSAQISKPIKAGKSGVPMKRLQVVLSAIMLRRLKTQTINGKPILELPDRNVEVVECEFDEDELEFYTALVERTDDKLHKMESGASMMGVLLLLLRLRQACCHPELCMKKVKDDMEAVNPTKAKSNEKDAEVDDAADDLADLLGKMVVKESTCEICQEVLPRDHKSQHCCDCEVNVVLKARRKSLPAAGNAVSSLESSAKIRKLMQILDEIDEKSEGQDKTIVFSQFTSFLDIIERFMNNKGIKFTRYDGSMKMDERTEALDRFQKSKTCNVALISFKAGSTGLNLTAANHVVLMDLWWNPSLEDQAFDRAHRYGQTKNVFIRKLVVPKTVEERIQQLQEKKRELATNALTGAKLGKGNGLRMDELLALFSHATD